MARRHLCSCVCYCGSSMKCGAPGAAQGSGARVSMSLANEGPACGALRDLHGAAGERGGALATEGGGTHTRQRKRLSHGRWWKHTGQRKRLSHGGRWDRQAKAVPYHFVEFRPPQGRATTALPWPPNATIVSSAAGGGGSS